jgi:regulation of enolase protein 1 (concanavalin A-like superfamily)
MLKRQKGQGLVEFALISPVLLVVILAIIEAALVFQGYLTVRHAAREAARWAVTYQPAKGMMLNGDPCDDVECDPDETDQEYWDRRVEYIKQKAVEKSFGLRFDEDHLGFSEADFSTFGSLPNFLGVEVWGFPSFEEPTGGWTDNDLRDHPGLPGLPVRVRVSHNVALLDPLIGAIVPAVRVVAQSEMINEGTQAGYGNVAPPALPPPPPLPSPEWETEITATPLPGGEESPTPEGTPDGTTTPTPTLSPTPTLMPTATPTGPYIAVSDYQVAPADVILIDVVQHAPGIHALRFVDDSFIDVAVISDTLVIDSSGRRDGIVYTIPTLDQGTYYVETGEARSEAIQVQPPAPDLVVRSIGFADAILPNEEITITMEVENLSAGTASGYFDVDLYVDPDYPPATNRPGTSKQWLDGLDPFETKVVTHVVMLYGGGVHEVWAQVDTTDWVPDELDENNNIFGPMAITAAPDECSELSDRFYPPDLDPKWSHIEWNAPTHNQTIEEIDGESTLTIETSGDRIGSTSERATYLYQAFTGDFVATLKINWAPATASSAKIGLMIRAGTSANSAMVAVSKTNTQGLQFLVRPSGGASAQNFNSAVGANTPVWVRLVRQGNGVSAFYSSDGSSWSGTDDANLSNLPATVLIGIAAASYSGSSSTGNVDDFEVCPIDGAADSCQGYSDDFEAGSTISWSDADFGSGTIPGSSAKTGGVMIVQGDGSGLWDRNEYFHYTYQQVSGDFVATLRVNRTPTYSSASKAGLMVRGSGDPLSALAMVMKLNDGRLQFARRPNDGDSLAYPPGYSAPTVGSPVWVRLARNGNLIAAYYSTNGTSWSHVGSATVNLSDSVLIGLAVSSYDGSHTGEGEFDDFLFCPGTGGDIAPPVEPPEEKPPGLKECVQTIELGNFEASSITPPWERNGDAVHASDRTHSGNFSLNFRASVGPRPEYRHLRPWAYQVIDVPGDVMVQTEGILSYWQYVVPDPPEETTRDPDDHFYLVIRDSGGVTQTANIPLAHGDTDTPVFQQNLVNVETHLPGNRFMDYAGQQVQLFFYGVHDGQAPGTCFYMDDVRFDICTTQPIPEPVPSTASIGGLIQVLLHARPTKMPGIQVWAFAPGGALYRTKTIHDSTYHFYNVPPGTYTIYAEVWTDGILYSGTTEVTVVSDERNYGVDMLLK